MGVVWAEFFLPHQSIPSHVKFKLILMAYGDALLKGTGENTVKNVNCLVYANCSPTCSLTVEHGIP